MLKLLRYSVPALLLFLSACEQDQTGTRKNGLVYCTEGSPESFNPQLVTSGTTIDAISQHLYDRLIDIDPTTGKFVPGLALSWHVSDDGLVYRFTLRPDVHFHTTHYFKPTRTLNAKDVLFTFDRVRSLDHPYHQTATEYPYFDSIEWRELVADIEMISSQEVEFRLSKPDSSFLSTLATDFAAILSEEYAQNLISVQKQADLDLFPIGTGPYLFRHYQKDVFIRYYRHTQHWRQQVQLEQLVIDIVPDNTKRLAKLLTKECDLAPLPRLSEMAFLSEKSDFVLDSETSMNVAYWAFNTHKPPLNDAHIRRALALAINKENILQAVYFGQAELANNLLPPTSWAFDKSISAQTYNPELAKKMLAAAGFPKGFNIDIWAMPVQRLYNPNALKMAELIKADLANIGVTAKIVSFEWNTFRRKLREGEHETVLIGWSADNADPDNFLRPLLSCAAAVSGSNRANWCDPFYDQLIGQAVLTADMDQRKQFYLQAQQYLTEQMPLMPIAHSKRFQIRNNKVTGVKINPYGGIHLSSAGKN